MGEISSIAFVYIVVITLFSIVIFYAWLKQRRVMRKNKFVYDLRDIRFEVEPLHNDMWKLNFYYYGEPLHSENVSEVDVFNDQSYFYKSFVKWCEEENR